MRIKGLKKSAREPSCASTVDVMVGQPQAAVDLLKLYIKVCETVKKWGKRDFQGKEEGERCGRGCIRGRDTRTYMRKMH